jgi:UDP-N-acetylglucosamine acyltransferase
MEIHETAIVHPDAEIAEDVAVGPYSVIGPRVRIGTGTRIGNHVTVDGHTTVGTENQFYPGVVVGMGPQDIVYQDAEETELVIGDRNVFREYVTVHRGTTKGGGRTRVGSDNYLMAYCHIAHDCDIGDRVVMANSVNIGGHCRIEDRAVFGGVVGVHHFVTIGTMAFVGGLSRIVQDVPPYMICEGNTSRVRHINLIGLKRNDLTGDDISALKEAFRLLYRSKLNTTQALEELEGEEPTEHVEHLIAFVRASQRGKQGRALQV